jgi:hypothetical protein
MVKNSKFAQLMRRDDVLRNRIGDAAFGTVVISITLGIVKIIYDYLENKIPIAALKYGLTLVATNFGVFLFGVFMLTIAKKEHFGQRSILVATVIASIYFGIKLYTPGLQVWILIVAWAFLSFVSYMVIKWFFEDIAKSID